MHYTVYLGRFSPVHLGHLHVIKTALEKSDYLIIGIGSSQQPRDIKNPWNEIERKDMIIKSCLDMNLDTKRIKFMFLNDYVYNDEMWMNQVEMSVYSIAEDASKISLIGHKKDNSSYYLSMFVSWDNIEVENYKGFNSTDIRKALFEYKMSEVMHMMTKTVYDELTFTISNSEILRLQKEYELVKEYKRSWEKAPYPPTFVTVDAVVTCGSHILMVKRGAAPGEGLWALPGGFINQYETIKDAVIRELIEETKIDIPKKVLLGCIRDNKVFDYPYRSLRGRTITHAYRISLKDKKLPKVKGSDDAAKAQWIPFSKLDTKMIFEDHYSIIQAMVNI